MDQSQEEFLRELLDDFKVEAAEHIEEIINGLLVLEKDNQSDESKAIIEKVFREIHSLKGASRAVNQSLIEQLCMSFESVFHAIKNDKIKLENEYFEQFYKAGDMLQMLVEGIDQKNTGVSAQQIQQLCRTFESMTSDSLPKTSSLFQQLQSKKEVKPQVDKKPLQESAPEEPQVNPAKELSTTGNKKPLSLQPTEPKASVSESETVRVATSKLYELLRQAEEMVSIKTALHFQIDQLNSIQNNFSTWRRSLLEQNNPNNQFAEDLASQNLFVRQHEEAVSRLRSNLEKLRHSTIRSVEELQLSVKKTLMFSFASLLNVAPKIVRDLSKASDKEVDLIIHGGEIEIDRRILEELKDPLIHLIRNCIDHGFESKQERIKAGKSPKGTLRIDVQYDANQKIELRISDDGAGIDLDKLKASALKNHIISQEELDGMKDSEIQMLIFSSGISTSKMITDVSGRGLGMAIVAEKITKIEGSIKLESKRHEGTTFTISLPQTLTSFRGILVRVANQLFILPTNSVVKALHLKPEMVNTIGSRKTIAYFDENIGLARLSDLLNIPSRSRKATAVNGFQALVVQMAQKKMALVIDEVMGEHEGVVKSLGAQLKKVRHIAGATLLGDGRIVPIVQISQLFESSHSMSGLRLSGGSEQKERETSDSGPKSILIAEDSITVRNMLRNLVEAAGYSVKTAVDGQEAFGFLQAEDFDLVVSDIEMPHMNGFELTSSIRQHAALMHLPVILVTSLDSADDRQRGLEAGANAYIIKSSFEKSNLIETINKLI